MAVSLSKIREQAPELVNLVKSAGVSLQKHPQLMGHAAKCALVLDYSGSMSGRYASGEVQGLAERALALATRFDDDGDIDIFLFDNTADNVGTLSISDYQGGINRLTRGRRMGLTHYEAAVDSVLRFYSFKASKRSIFSKSDVVSLPVDYPVYCMFVTDGEPSNRAAAEQAIVEAANYPVFWQFMGLGGKLSFLDKLDTLPGRKVDNAGAFGCTSHKALTDEQLFDKLLSEYPSWVTKVQKLGMIK